MNTSPLVNESVADVEHEEAAPRLLDAARSAADAEAPPALAEHNGSALATKWFILEPAVFLIFMGRSLIGA